MDRVTQGNCTSLTGAALMFNPNTAPFFNNFCNRSKLRRELRHLNRLLLKCTRLPTRSAQWQASAVDQILDRSAKCPLLAQSGHCLTGFQCPLLGVKRTLIGHATMTADGSKAEVPRHCGLRGSYWREAGVETSETPDRRRQQQIKNALV